MKSNFEEMCFFGLEVGTENCKEDEFQVSGGSEFLSCGPMREKACLPRDVQTFGMEKSRESDDIRLSRIKSRYSPRIWTQNVMERKNYGKDM